MTLLGYDERGSASRHRRTSFFGAYDVSCRVRAERVKPYASQGSLAGDSPRGPVRSLAGPPPPSATRGLGVIGILLSTSRIRPAVTVVNGRCDVCPRVLFTRVRGETVWKLRTGSVSWSHEAAQRGEIAHFSALGVTEKRLIRPVQIFSRQSLEGEFCELRVDGVLKVLIHRNLDVRTYSSCSRNVRGWSADTLRPVPRGGSGSPARSPRFVGSPLV